MIFVMLYRRKRC